MRVSDGDMCNLCSYKRDTPGSHSGIRVCQKPRSGESISGIWFSMKPQSYENNYVYMFDGAYLFGNAFAPALEQALGGEMLPAHEMGEITFFAGIFEGGRWGDPSDGSSEYYYPGELANYVSPAVSAILLMTLAAGSLTVAVLMTERKDVG